MFIKNGNGTIIDVLKEQELSDEQKKSVKEAVATKEKTDEKKGSN